MSTFTREPGYIYIGTEEDRKRYAPKLKTDEYWADYQWVIVAQWDDKLSSSNIYRRKADPIAILTSERDTARAKLDVAEKALKDATEVKAGDWAVAINVNACSSLTLNNLYHIESADDYWIVVEANDAGVRDPFGRSNGRFRRATPAEIEAHLKANPPIPPLPKLHGHEGSYIKGSLTVVYGCAHIFVDHLRPILGTLSIGAISANRTIAAVISDKGEKITMDEIKAILTHVDYVNSH